MLNIIFEIFFGFIIFGSMYIFFLLWGQPKNTTSKDTLNLNNEQLDSATFSSDDFSVLSKQTILLQNTYKHNCSLKFSISNSNINKIEHFDRKMTNIKLENDCPIVFHKKEWKNLQVTEYHFRWSAECAQSRAKEVCFHFAHNNATWFNTFQTATPNWPMSTTKAYPATPINSLSIITAICANTPDLVSENLFLNSDGFAILLPKQSPIFVQILPNKSDPLICISTRCKLPYLEEPPDASYQSIKFTIISGYNMRTLYDALSNQLRYIPKPLAVPDESIFTFPSWVFIPGLWIKQSVLKNFCQKSIQKFTAELKNNGFEKCLLLIGCGWDQTEKYLKFNKTLFANPHLLLAKLHRRGYRVGLSISPNVKVEAVHIFTNKILFLQNFNHQPQLNEKSRTLIPDFTNAKSERWFAEKIDSLNTKHSSDQISTINCTLLSFRQILMQTYFQKKEFDVYYCFEKLQLYSDDFLFHDPLVQQFPYLFVQKYLQLLTHFGSSTIFFNALSSQEQANFIRIPERVANWSAVDGLKSLIPVVLTCSLAGYSFLIPDIVGGRYGRPSAELYIRWVQATAFMPSMLFAIPPWDYESPKVAEITKKYVSLHIEHSKTILKLAKRRVEHGEPIIRPLWYIAPEDKKTYSINDQFCLGNNILVAPVLNVGQRDRIVYLPTGLWEDQNGNKHTGPREITVLVPLDELPYFKRFDKL